MYLVCHNTPRIRRDLPQLSGYPKVVLHITSISSEIIDIISQSAVTAAGNSNESVPCSHQVWAEDSEVPASIWFCAFHRDLRQLAQYSLSSASKEIILTWPEYETDRKWHASIQ